MTKEPEPPQDVRAHMRDGTVIPLELIYDGVDGQGHHVWVAVFDLHEVPDHVTIAVLPTNTAIRVTTRGR